MARNAVRVFLLVFAVALLPVFAQPAQAQSHVWGQDGWCYQSNGSGWVRTSYFRWFPEANNWQLYDLYLGGQWLKRVDVRYPGWTLELPAANADPSSQFSWWMLPSNPQQATASNVYFLERATNQWWTLAQLTAILGAQSQNTGGAGYVLGNPAGVIGGRESTPNPNPLTVDSIAAERALSQMSPQLRSQFMAAVGPLASYYLVR